MWIYVTCHCADAGTEAALLHLNRGVFYKIFWGILFCPKKLTILYEHRFSTFTSLELWAEMSHSTYCQNTPLTFFQAKDFGFLQIKFIIYFRYAFKYDKYKYFNLKTEHFNWPIFKYFCKRRFARKVKILVPKMFSSQNCSDYKLFCQWCCISCRSLLFRIFPSKHKATKWNSKGVFNRTINFYYQVRKLKERAFPFCMF